MKRLAATIAVAIAVVCGLGALATDSDLAAVFGLPADPFTATATVGVVSCSATKSAAVKLNLNREQLGHAATIYEVALSMDMGDRGAVIGIATAMQESTLHNYGHRGEANDHDSLGLFQQRPSKGWGTPEEITDPEHAATSFFKRLKNVEGWRTIPLTEAAQAVQRSAFPDAYAKWEPLADDVTDHFAKTCTQKWIAPVKADIVSDFRTKTRPDHDGIDLGAPRGTSIRAASEGTVVTVLCDAVDGSGQAHSCNSDGGQHIKGCGWYVDIRHPDATLTRYCHMGQRPSVEEGDDVRAGQTIGEVGSSGNSSGPHLHFETHHGCDRSSRTGVNGCAPTDPVDFLAKRSVKLPAP